MKESAVEESAVEESTTVSLSPLFFKPIDPSAPESPGTTTGTRTGSCFDSDDSVQLMAPTAFIGKTATATPTFTWALPDDVSVPVEFNLYSLQPSGELEVHHSVEPAYAPGISQYQVPTESALEANQSYLWQMVLHCNPNRPSQALVYEGEVEFMPELTGIAPSGSVIEQSKGWAAAGYWYDAIAILGTSTAPEVVQMRAALLNDLTILEAAMSERMPEE